MGNGGLVATLLGILAVICAWGLGKTVGKSTGKKEMKQAIETDARIKTAETERDIAEAAAQTVGQITAQQAAVQSYFDEFKAELDASEKKGDIDAAIEASRKLAERATAWQKRDEQ